MSNITVAQTFAAIRALRIHGITVARTDGEWRIRLNGNEASDYFTNDNEDAIDTARAMAAQALGAVTVDSVNPGDDSADGWYFRHQGFGGFRLPAGESPVFVGPFLTRDEASEAAAKVGGIVSGQYDIGELSKIAANPEGFYYRAVWLVPTPGSVTVLPAAERMVEVTAPGGERRTLTVAGVRTGLTRAIGADEAADVLALLLAYPGKPQTVLTRQLQAVTFRLIPA